MSTARTPHDRWVYLRAYLAAGFAAVEHLVRDGLPAILAAGGHDRWFFLRYLDDDGLHVRVRLRASGDPAALAAQITPRVTEALAAADRAEPSRYCPTIVPPPALAAPYVECRRPAGDRVVADRYQPELDRFGAAGIDVAEALFQHASELAIVILRGERDGRLDRKQLAPVLMHGIQRAFVPAGAAPGFWSRYARYWLDPVPGLHARWIPRFAAKAQQLAAAGVDVRHATGDGEALCATWFAEHATIVGRRGLDRAPADLAFHFIHLMNNRLGLMPIEEAYFATLLGAAVGEELAA